MVILGLLIIVSIAIFTAFYGWDQWQTHGLTSALGIWLLALTALLVPIWVLLT